MATPNPTSSRTSRRQNNVKFKPKYYTGGDNMLGLISQSPPGTFDVILSDAEYVQQLNAAGYIEELDPADYPFDDFFPEFQQFPGHWQGDKLYSVLTRFGFLGVAYNTDAITEKEALSYDVYLGRQAEGQGRPLRLAPAQSRPDQPARTATPRPTTSTRTPGARCRRR